MKTEYARKEVPHKDFGKQATAAEAAVTCKSHAQHPNAQTSVERPVAPVLLLVTGDDLQGGSDSAKAGGDVKDADTHGNTVQRGSGTRELARAAMPQEKCQMKDEERWRKAIDDLTAQPLDCRRPTGTRRRMGKSCG